MPTETTARNTLTEGQRNLIENLSREYARYESDREPNEERSYTNALHVWITGAEGNYGGASRYIDAVIANVRHHRDERRRRDQIARDAAALTEVQAARRFTGEYVTEPSIPDGYYAVERGADSTLRFYSLRTDRQGRQVLSRCESDNRRRFGFTNARNPYGARYAHYIPGILRAINAAGITAAAQRYGVEMRHCFCCNRELTDETSRSLGIGPVCRSERGRHAAWRNRTYTATTPSGTYEPPAPVEPQVCSVCNDVAVGQGTVAVNGHYVRTAFCDECALDSDIDIVLFPARARRRTSAA